MNATKMRTNKGITSIKIKNKNTQTMALIVLLFHLSDIWPELPTERLLQNESHSVWRATGM